MPLTQTVVPMCKKCHTKSNYKTSPRQHGKHPHVQFRVCANCGKTVQGTIQIDGSFREFSTSVYKGGSHQLRFRFSDQQFEAMKKLGKNPRQLAERGLEAFLNE